MTKTMSYGSTLDLSTVTPTYKSGYSGVSYTKTSGSGSISGNTFTVGAGVTTITLNATTIETPVPTVSIASTSKVYGASTTALSASVSNTYDSGITVNYTYYYDTSSSGSYANTQTSSISAKSHKGTRYYKVKATATDGTLTSSTGTSSNNVSLALIRAKLTPNVNSCGTLSSTSAVYSYSGESKVYTASTGGSETTWPTITAKTGYTVSGWYTATSGGTKVLNADGSLTGTAVSGYTSASAWAATANKTLYAQCTSNTYTITIKAGNGISKVALSGWTNTGTATMTKTMSYGSTLDLSTVTPTYKSGYSGVSYTKTSGSGSISGNTFTVGAGVTTITLNATTLSAPVPSISTSNTSKVYGSSDTTLTATQTTTYDSGVNVYYNFGNSTSSSGTYTYGTASTTATTTVSKTSHFGVKYYKVKAYATDGTLKSTTATWSSYMSVTLTNPAITLNANSCGTIGTGTNPFYAKYGTTNIYTTKTGSTAATFPTFTVNSGYTVSGWYTATSGGTKVLNADGSLTGTAVSGYTSASAWAATANKTLYAQCTANTYTIIYEKNQGDGTDSTCPNTVSGTMANTTATYGASNTLRTNAYGCSSRVFVGWYAYREYVNDSGSTVKQYNGVCDGTAGWKTATQIASCTTWEKTIYADKAAVSKTSPSGTVKMYAQWEKYAIYEDTDGNTTTLSGYASSLSDAVDDVVDLGGGTIMALVNTTESSSVNISKTSSGSDDGEDTSTTSDELILIIMPNGKTIDMGANKINISGSVDVSITGTGTITGTNVVADNRGVISVRDSALLNLDGPTISNTSTATTVTNSISLLVQGANLNVVSGSITGANVGLGLFGGRITINDGTIKGNSYGVYFGADYVVEETSLNVLGGTILTGLHTEGDYTGSYGIYLPASSNAHSTVNIGSNDWDMCVYSKNAGGGTGSSSSSCSSSSTPVIYGYNSAIYSPDTDAVININRGKLESYKYSTISNYGTVNLGDTTVKGADSSSDADVRIASQSSYAISNYSTGTIKYYPGTYSYSKSTSGTIYNLGEIELAGGLIYGIPSSGSIFNNSGTINMYGTWKGHSGTYTYGSDSSYTYSGGVYVSISGMTSYSSYSSGTSFSVTNNNISAISSTKNGSANNRGFKLSLVFSAPSSTTGSTTLTITPKLYVGYSTYTSNCYGTVKISCSNGSTATYTGKYDFRNYVGSTLYINSSATSCSTVNSIITSSSSSAGKLTMGIKKGDSISCSASFTGSSKVGSTTTVSGSVTAK